MSHENRTEVLLYADCINNAYLGINIYAYYINSHMFDLWVKNVLYIENKALIMVFLMVTYGVYMIVKGSA